MKKVGYVTIAILLAGYVLYMVTKYIVVWRFCAEIESERGYKLGRCSPSLLLRGTEIASGKAKDNLTESDLTGVGKLTTWFVFPIHEYSGNTNNLSPGVIYRIMRDGSLMQEEFPPYAY